MRKRPPKRDTIMRVPGILVRTVEDEAFLIDPEADSIHHMNRLGLAVWRLIEKPMTRREIAALLIAAFPDTPPKQIRTDLGRLIKLLLAERLAKRRAS